MKLKRVEGTTDLKADSCLGCIGNESNIKCLEISELSAEQGLSFCGRENGIAYIYREDKAEK